jgi:hypothetical protein
VGPAEKIRRAAEIMASEPCEDGAMGTARDGGPTGEPVETEIESEEDEGGGFDSWRRESALGAVGTGIARGLHAVFAPRADEVVIVAAVPGEPPDADQRLQVILDPDDPTKSIAVMPKTPREPPAE